MENRFLEMDDQFKTLRRNGRSNSYSFGKSRPLYSGSFEAVDYTVPGIVGPLKQPSGNVCWATVATMMMNWQRQQSQSIDTAIGSIGQNWLLKFKKDQGLMSNEKVPFLHAAGFQFEYPQNPTIGGWEDMLRRYGPIWVTTDEDPSVKFAIHARIISGIRGDGTGDNTYLKITDPAKGNQYDEKFSNFLSKYEDEVRTLGASWSGRIQIVHWPEGDASTAKSFSNERTHSLTISAAGIAMIKRFEGFRGNLYNDPAGHCSVGYGELVHKGNCNGDASEQPYQSGISEADATRLLTQKLQSFERLINDAVTVEMNQNQFDSLISFSYNVGSGNFRQSTLLRLLNAGNYGAVPAEFRKWTKGRVNGQLVDLPGLVNRRNEEAGLFANPNSVAQSLSDANYSSPFYDTGEHSVLGMFVNSVINAPIADLYELAAGTTYDIKGITFTYGQIITLGDFYKDYKTLISASTTELDNLKKLIVRSEEFYKNTIFKLGLANLTNPEDEEYDKVTSKRYSDLAAVNNSHFAPPPPESIFKDSKKPNNKLTWEDYHTQAIQRVRKGNTGVDYDEAIKLNAFGNHFLTDAFSAGHLINKELFIKLFKIQVLKDNGKVSDSGTQLFDRISKQVFRGDLAKEFSKYQTTGTKYFVHGFLDNPGMFKTLLIGILEQEPDVVSNLFIKAIHDTLNEYNNKTGVPVVNAIGGKGEHWNLTGDGTLNTENIIHIQQAIRQSVLNLRDAVNDKTTSINDYKKRVWDYVPIPTAPDTKSVIDKVFKDFISFDSNNALVDKTKEIMLTKKGYVLLIEKLLDKKAIELRESGVWHPVNTVGNIINNHI